MKFKLIGLGIFIAMILTETHSVFTYLWPNKAEIDVRDWFIKPVPFFVPLKWWIKFSTDNILLCVMWFALARISLMVSYRLFLIFAMWFLYFAFDYFMFLYHYKLDYQFYWVLLGASIYTVFFLILPMKEDRDGGIIRRLFESPRT
jgi:hypothetical protein